MKVELRHLSGLFPSLNTGNVCPACPKVRLCSTIIFPFTYLQEINFWVIVFASHTDYYRCTMNLCTCVISFRRVDHWSFLWMPCLVFLGKKLLE